MKHGGLPWQRGHDPRRWRRGRVTRFKGELAETFTRMWMDRDTTVEAIEAQLGLPRGGAYYAARYLKLPHRSAIRRRPVRYTNYVRSLIQKDYFVRGLSQPEIRRTRGYSDWMVRRAIREAGMLPEMAA